MTDIKLKPFSRKVFYYETDKMGIVHHSNYLRWFEESRVDILDQAGLPFETVEAEGVLSPVLSASCKYILPFHFNETFFVKTIIDSFGGARFSVSYSVYDNSGCVHVTGTTTHCFTDDKLRPLRIRKTHPHVFSVYEELYRRGESLYDE